MNLIERLRGKYRYKVKHGDGYKECKYIPTNLNKEAADRIESLEQALILFSQCSNTEEFDAVNRLAREALKYD